MRVAGVVLAAGASRRLGRPKQLVVVDGEALVHRIARAVLEAGCAPVVVVTGAGALAVEAAVAGLDVAYVRNERFEEGLASSLRAGVGAAARATPPCDGALLTVVDQPAVDAALFRELLACFAAAGAARPVACAYADALGVPAVMPRALFPELAALRGDAGAKSLLAARGEEVVAVPFPAGALDLDTAADLARTER